MLRDARTRTAGLVRLNTVLLLREPGPVISRLLMPVILMVILRPLYVAAQGAGVGPLAGGTTTVPTTGAHAGTATGTALGAATGTTLGTIQAVTGMSVMFSLLALGLVGSGILTERGWHTWDRLRSSATRPVEILVAKSVPTLGFLAAQQTVVMTVGVLALGLRVDHPAPLVLATGTWVVMLLGLGTALGTFARSHAELGAVQDVGGLVLTSLGGALVPLAILPGWVHHVAPVSPGYWGVQAMTAALTGDTARALHATVVLAGVALAAVTLASWRVRRGWGRSDLL